MSGAIRSAPARLTAGRTTANVFHVIFHRFHMICAWAVTGPAMIIGGTRAPLLGGGARSRSHSPRRAPQSSANS